MGEQRAGKNKEWYEKTDNNEKMIKVNGTRVVRERRKTMRGGRQRNKKAV